MTYSTPIGVQFYPFTPSMAKKLREAGLSAAEWRFWSYLTEQDPWGDNYKELDPLDIMRECGMSKATYYRAKAKFQELGLFDFQESKACVRNLEGITKMRREAQKSEATLKNQTATLKNETAELEMRPNPQKRENQSLRPLPSKDSAPLQTNSDFNKTNQTLSEATRERNLFFWNDFDEETRSQLNYYAYQVALPKLPIRPTLPNAWISYHCEELWNQMMYDVEFQKKWEKLSANSLRVENKKDTSEAEPHDTIDW
jgi:hypothetical protein